MADKVSLYLAINLPQGKKFKLFDRATRRINYNKPPIYLYPDRPTEVTEDEAFMLQQLNPTLVSTKPYNEENDPQAQLRRDLHEKQTIVAPPEEDGREEANLRFQKGATDPLSGKTLIGKIDAIGSDGDDETDDITADYMGTYLDKLSKLNDLGLSFDKMPVPEIRQHLKDLDSPFTSKSKDKLVAALTNRVTFITQQIEKEMKEAE